MLFPLPIIVPPRLLVFFRPGQVPKVLTALSHVFTALTPKCVRQSSRKPSKLRRGQIASNSRYSRSGSRPRIARSSSSALSISTIAMTRLCPATLYMPISLNPSLAALASSISRSQTSSSFSLPSMFHRICIKKIIGSDPRRCSSFAGRLERTRMVAEGVHVNLHEGVEWQRTQNFVEFVSALHIEHADVCILACDAPEMQPLTLQLQFLGALVLLGTELFNLVRIRVMRDADVDAHVEQHVSSRVTPLFKSLKPGFGPSFCATERAHTPMRPIGPGR